MLSYNFSWQGGSSVDERMLAVWSSGQERRDRYRHGLGSKSTRAILLHSWKRHFTMLSPVWRSWQAVLDFIHISLKKLKNQNKKFQADSNIFASPEAGGSNCLPYVSRLHRFPASQEDKYRDEMKYENGW